MTTPPTPDTSTAAVETLRNALRARYTITEELGRGAMSIVYRAHDQRFRRDVAVKVLRSEYSFPLGAERFIREIEFAARLQHPHILPVLDSGAVDSVMYYVMPCVDGRSLRDHLRSEGQLAIPDAIRIACEVGSALSYAHMHGVVHRDVKPANILLSSGVAVVADFGIAHAVAEAGGERLTGTGLIIGTPGYMSPEQATGDQELDARSDIYSLGCVLYEMLAGEPPFTGRTSNIVIARTLQASPPPLRVARSSVPPGLERIVERALAKAPADRFRTADEFVHALKTVALHPQPEPEPSLWRRRRARPTLVALAAAAVVAAGFGINAMTGTGDLDEEKVVVFPPTGHGLSPTESGAAYGVALAINGAFDYAQPLRLIEGWTRIDESTLTDPSRLPHADALRIARDRGARYYLDGDLQQGAAGSLVLALRLNDASGDSLIVSHTATAPVGPFAIQAVAFEAISRILPYLLAPGRKVDLSPLTARHPAAVGLWIKGELAYRRARFDSALAYYRRAVEQDSTAAFAAIRGAQAASWIRRSDDASRLVAVAMVHRSLLPRRHEAFAVGFDAYLDGHADTAATMFERLLAESPEWGEAAMALGEVYYHLLPKRSSLDSLADAAFRRVIASDSLFTPALVHLTELAIRRGDVNAADGYLDRLRAEPESKRFHRPLVLALACVRRGASSTDWGDLAEHEPAPSFSAAELLAGGAADPGCAEAGLRAVRAVPGLDPGTAWGATVSLHGLLMAQGRHDEALELVDSAVASGRSFANILYILDTWAGAPAESRGVVFDSVARSRWGVDYAGLSSLQARWALGIWNVWRGDTAVTRAISRRLAQEVDTRGALRPSILARALDAHLTLASGDSSTALQKFRALVPVAHHDSLMWGFAEPLPVERLVLARLLYARGEYPEAMMVAEGFAHPSPAVYLAFLPPSLVIRHRAAEALGLEARMLQARTQLEGLGRRDLLDTLSRTPRRNR